jgi:hypothetical protein
MYRFVCLALLTIFASCAYEPELMLTVQPSFLNRIIANSSDTIIKAINSYHIADPAPITETVAGVKITATLKDIKQKFDIHWVTNIMTVTDTHSFKINSKNINITLSTELEAKVGYLKKQKGPLKITVSQL